MTDNKTQSEPQQSGRMARRRLGRGLKWLAVLMLALAVGGGGYLYYRHMRFYPATGDAYIKANTVDLAPQVTGRLIDVAVNDQQSVKKGELLFRINPRPFADQVAEAQAALDNARQTVAVEQAGVEAARAGVADRQAILKTARKDFYRAQNLVARKVAAQSRLDDATAALDTAKAQLGLARAQLNEAKNKLGPSGDGNSQIELAKAKLDQAKLDLAHTRVTASCSGRLSGFTLREGDIVLAGEKEAVLVCSRRFWVYANFKETDLTRIRPGQTATVNVDMYPNHPFHGIVESINPASGAAFSLLPPENATGNWVKVTQRVPVRILITDAGDGYPLRVQTSAEVTVDTGTKAKPLGEARNATISDAAAMKLANAGDSGP